MINDDELAELKTKASMTRHEAEKAAHAYFAALPLGPEREWAYEVYDRIRVSIFKG